MSDDEHSEHGRQGEATAAEGLNREVEELLYGTMDPLDRELAVRAAAVAQRRESGEEDPDLRRRRLKEVIDRGRPMAIFSYFSVMFGLPVFVVPMVLRDNRYALHHAKAAGVIYLICMGLLGLALTNCAFFLPLVFVCYIPALIGIYRAAAGAQAGTAALGGLGERVFRRVKIDSNQVDDNGSERRGKTTAGDDDR